MTERPTSDIAFTSFVKSVQQRLGSRGSYVAMEQRGGWQSDVTSDLAAFIAARDTLFLATVNEEGQPYIQHRGGPIGFLKVIDEHTLGFADFSGNRQYISVGNLDDNPKAFIFLLDFANRRRVKIWGRAEVVAADHAMRESLHDKSYGSAPERLILFHIDAWDVNCPQHIKPRFTHEEIEGSIQSLKDRIAQLEAECKGCEPKE